MKIQINRNGRWVETGWESSTPLAEVLDDEQHAAAARRVNAHGEVLDELHRTAEPGVYLTPGGELVR